MHGAEALSPDLAQLVSSLLYRGEPQFGAFQSSVELGAAQEPSCSQGGGRPQTTMAKHPRPAMAAPLLPCIALSPKAPEHHVFQLCQKVRESSDNILSFKP